jgi:MFS family permease
MSRGIFYGWIVVAAAFSIVFLGFGSAYTFSAFFDSLQREFSASRGSVSLVFSLAGFLYFSLGILSGPWGDRIGVKRLALAGMLLIGIGLVLAGLARSLTAVYWAYSLGVGLGIGLAYVPVVGVVQRWFIKRRAFASGLAVSGIGVGTLVMPPLATALIGAIGWRDTYVALGGIVAVVGVSASLLIVDDPRDKQLHPDGDGSDAAMAASARSGIPVREAVGTRQVRGLYMGCLACAFGVFIPFVHLIPSALGHGVNPAGAARLLGMIGVGSTAGRFFLGGIADRLGRRAFLVAMYVGMAASLLIWACSATFAGLATFALLFGLFYGGWVAILPAVAADCFGIRHVGGIIGVLYTSIAFGTLIGPSTAGFIFDLQQSYTLPIIVSAAATLLAALISGVTLRAK